MSTVQELLAKQATNFGLIARAVANLNKLGKARITPTVVRSRLALLKEYWEQCRANHSVIEAFASEDLRKNEDYFTKELFLNANDAFENASDSMSETLDALTKPVAQQALDENLPTFSGDYVEWQQFHDLFSSLVINNQSLSKVQKLHYLKSTLTGEAGLLLKNVVIAETNFQSAWDLLNKRYANKRSLVHALLQSFLDIPKLTSQSNQNLRILRDKSSDIRSALINLKRPVKQWEDLFNFIVIAKLDNNTRREWELTLGDDTELPTYDRIDDFLTSRIRANEAISDSHKAEPATSNSNRNYDRQDRNSKQRFIRSHNAIQALPPCVMCSQAHLLHTCTQYMQLSPQKRREFLIEKQCCLNCLRFGHRHQQCRNSRRCFKCQKTHHTTIHTELNKFNEASHSSSAGNLGRNTLQAARQQIDKQNFTTGEARDERNREEHVNISNNNFTNQRLNAAVLPTAYVVLHSHTGRAMCVRALLDQGSQYSFVTESVAQFLKLKKKTVKPVTISGIADAQAGVVNSIATLKLSPCDNETQTINFEALIMRKLTSYAPRVNTEVQNFKHLNDLRLADPEPFADRRIDVLIGAELFGKIMLPGLRTGPHGTPIAQNTIFGWIISGPTRANPPTESTSSNKINTTINVNYAQINDLENLLTRFWEMENVPESKLTSPAELLCEQQFKDTHQRTATGRYIVRIPIKLNSQVNIGETREIARRVLLSNEKRLTKKPELLTEYQTFLKEYLKLNHMRKVDTVDDNTNIKAVYLPHHPVIKETSQTTKLRVVFNASKLSTSGKSLNDFQYIGEKLQSDLAALLMRWRRYRYVYIADIEKMFRQILVDERDVDLQRILWRENFNDDINEYQLLTVTYGTASAPYLANRVLKQLANDEQSNFPLAAEILDRDVYVDDVMFGANDENHAKLLREQLTRLLMAGGFHLYKWASNSISLLHAVTDAPHAFAVDKKLSPDERLKVLGLNWTPCTDTFNFTLNLQEQSTFTKRTFLSLIAKIFDPLGWLTPFTINGKIIIQELWLLQINWDTQLTTSIQDKCTQYQAQLKQIHKLKIPRWIDLHSNSENLQIHGFSDASERAYAAAVYVRTNYLHSSPVTSLIIAKSKVAPLKTLSIPRLELCGAQLLIQLIEYATANLKLNSIPIYCWTDSTVVLQWLRQHPSKWHTFVANRVSRIQTSSCKVEWKHVRSKHNPADCASRGIGVDELVTSSLWWNGPPWLSTTADEWPKQTDTQTTTEIPKDEIKVNSLQATVTYEKQTTKFDLINRYSKLDKLLRVTAYIFKFIDKLRSAKIKIQFSECVHEVKTTDYLTSTEIHKALDFHIKQAQKADFADEIRLLQAGSSITNKSKIVKLSPYLDEHNLLRVGGRLRSSFLSEDRKHPIILGNTRFTELLIAKTHSKTLHGGVQTMLHDLRQHYWIVTGRVLIKRHIRNCVICVRYRANTLTQRMGDLPTARTQPSRPFTHTGVDYAGPFFVRTIAGRGNKTHKCYIALFVCLAVKAIHLELVQDYSTAAFLAALSRFTARRGLPAVIYSDNGTNFRGANAELIKHFQNVTHETNFLNKIASDAIAWRFIPPAAPHFGGLWEAGVKSVKHHLRRILGDFCPTVEEFTTLLCGIECCLNSRPLTILHDETESLETLTPGHFLVGDHLKTVPSPTLLHLNENRLSRWQSIQLMQQRFWKVWQDDYLTALQARQKWTKINANLKVGDIVLIKNSNLPPPKWEIGRILTCIPGQDGLTRVATIKTANSEYTRPITQLCLLPTNNKADEATPLAVNLLTSRSVTSLSH